MIPFLSLFTIISAVSIVASPGVHANAELSGKPSAEIIYTIPIGSDRHLVHLQVCAGEKTITPSIAVVSPQENVSFNAKKILPAHTCLDYEVVIKAKHSEMIRLR